MRHCAVIRLNNITVTQMHVATPTCSVSLKDQTRDKFNRLFFFLLVHNMVFPYWCETMSSFPAGA